MASRVSFPARIALLVGCALALALFACSGTSGVDVPSDPAHVPFEDAGATNVDGGVDRVDGGAADAFDAPPSFHTAPHPDLPRELRGGGKVLAHPRFVPITFDGEPFRANIETLLEKIGTTNYWSNVTAEYGVGPATRGRPVHLNEPLPSTIVDASLKLWLAAKLDGTHPEFDPPDEGTIYVIYFPSGVTYELGGATGCVEFGASDNYMVMPNGKKVPYIAVPRCPAKAGLDAWNSLSLTTSHELVEESTDPFKDAWVTLDDDHISWSGEAPFSEIADVCYLEPTAGVVDSQVGAAVQRVWSNRAAAAGHNPCVPAPAGVPYFNAAPELDEDVMFSLVHASTGTTYSHMTKGVQVGVGQTKTIGVTLFSDAPMAPWRVRAFDLAAAAGRPPELELTLDRDHGTNGDKLTLTIHPLRAGAGGGSRFALLSDDGLHSGFWLGWVAN